MCGGGGLHRLHISYADPLFLAGPYYIAVYASQNATFHLNVTVEQVARQVEIGRAYAAAISTTVCMPKEPCKRALWHSKKRPTDVDVPQGACATDADCASSNTDTNGEHAKRALQNSLAL